MPSLLMCLLVPRSPTLSVPLLTLIATASRTAMLNYQILNGFANQLNPSSDCYDVIVAVAAQPKYAGSICSDAFDQARITESYVPSTAHTTH